MVSKLKNVDRVIHGDCTTALLELPDDCIDLVVTDPPYLVGYRDRGGRRVLGDDDTGGLIVQAFAEVGRVLKAGRFAVSFYGWNRARTFLGAWEAAGLFLVGHIIWVKSYASSSGATRRHHEQAYLLSKGLPRRPRFALPDVQAWRYTGNRLHPTQKPLMAIRPLVDAYSWPGEVVLDPFAGSGTTAMAALQLGRHYLAIERSAEHVATARARLARARRKTYSRFNQQPYDATATTTHKPAARATGETSGAAVPNPKPGAGRYGRRPHA